MTSISKRKQDHIQICLEEEVEGLNQTNGFDQYHFQHEALPEIHFHAISTRSSFLGKALKVPYLVSSMTGGTDEATRINRKLAKAAQERGWAFGVGSVRAAIEHPELMDSFRVRDVAPDVPILTNLGAVQLNEGYGVEACQQAVEAIEADGLVLHLNSLQEIFQPEGDVNFEGLLSKIEQLCRALPFPVGVKEVGFGINGKLAQKLIEAGVAFVDVAGAGGTSWIQVEKYRLQDPVRRAAAQTFAEWGIPTAVCLEQMRSYAPHAVRIASGGMKNGLDAAKAMALGGHLVGFGRTLLPAAVEGEEPLHLLMQQLEFELRAAMFGVGCADLDALGSTDALHQVDRTPPMR
ncbi:type 2 isopentenyl-diphosphate Delta-isomerase [Marinicrinis sediminis]|uniref:Isopentenyl-diphosphate delta-isomerase n=1 Tax=Marinicrinis sediminis TaxID=1652465 RepID=A0ABW5R5N5_9BACL